MNIGVEIQLHTFPAFISERKQLTLNLLAPTTVGARINPYPAEVEKMVSS